VGQTIVVTPSDRENHTLLLSEPGWSSFHTVCLMQLHIELPISKNVFFQFHRATGFSLSRIQPLCD
jgi:hypothetical protein